MPSASPPACAPVWNRTLSGLRAVVREAQKVEGIDIGLDLPSFPAVDSLANRPNSMSRCRSFGVQVPVRNLEETAPSLAFRKRGPHPSLCDGSPPRSRTAIAVYDNRVASDLVVMLVPLRA